MCLFPVISNLRGRKKAVGVHVWIGGFVVECEDERVKDVNFCFLSYKPTKQSTYKPTKEISYKPTKESNIVKLN